jgi:staphyloferrin B biosynthesis citrate synthase
VAEAVDVTPFVRVPEADPAAVLRCLDAGAMGVVIAHVRRRADVNAAIRAARYAPEGMRSLGGGRVPGFGRIDLVEYVRMANAEIMAVPMIEDEHAVADLPAILAGGSVDLILEGAADVSQAYGVPCQTRHPTMRGAVRRIHAVCAQAGVPFCAIPRTRDDHAQWRAAGVRAFVPGEERGLAARTLREHLADHRSPDNL